MEKMPLREQIDFVRDKYAKDPFRLTTELRKLLKKAEKVEDVYAIGKINLLLAVCIFHQGGRESIFSYAYKAVSILETLDDYKLLARSYNILGVAYAGQGNYQQAISVYQKALKLIRSHRKLGVRRETLLNNIAQCYSQMGQYWESIRLVKECLSTVRAKRPDLHSSAVIYGINLSDFYEKLGQYDLSIAYLDEVKPDTEFLSSGIVLRGYYARRSCILYKRGQADEGAKFADLTIQAVNSGSDSYEGHDDFEKIAFMEVQKGDYLRAQLVADILTRYAGKNGHTLDQIISKRVQASICYATGERERAFLLYKELNDLYEFWMKEQRAIQYEAQKSVESAGREISKLMKKAQISQEKAERDPLTGLMNRSALLSVTNSFFQKAREKESKLGAIFFDIDFFKGYNDTYGHAEGDEVIKLIAKVCMAEENAAVKFFRYGGDEYFGVVLGASDEELEKLALRISENVRNSGVVHAENPNGHRLTVSIGIVNADVYSSQDTVLDILKYADKALYHAKNSGKDDVFAYVKMPNSQHEFKRIDMIRDV